MKKVLKCLKEDDCIGCGLCVLMASYLRKKAFSLSDSCLTIKRNPQGKNNFSVKIDQGLCQEMPEVVDICPSKCLVLVEGEED